MDVLSTRALNRATLHRQWLTERHAAGPVEAAAHLVGLQAQSGDAPYYQLHSRLAGFTTGDLSAALTSREVARLVLMRGTIHLVAARDAVPMRAVVQPFLNTVLFNSTAGQTLVGIDTGAVAAAARDLLADGPLPGDELGARLAERWPQYTAGALVYLARCVLPLVQVPPRGVWGEGGGLVYALAEQWLDVPPGTDGLDELVLRYLAAFGPATVVDAQKWSSLAVKGLREAFERLRPKLVTYRGEDGRELFDVAGTELPDADLEVPPLLLGPFDNILLSYADRTRIIAKDDVKAVFTKNGIVRGTLVLDGFVAGVWKPALTRRRAVLECTPLRSLTRREKAGLEERGEELLAFAAPGAGHREVVFGEG
ncbi:hypothetical protein SRB5_37910 [Streptomyces sp. RB5]|uniref:Winged helix DNA-binding domain-containing protein n=1 Tax=Streptomyces smaragdinus TaxID=2585196 RepID=A0A7K0CJR0_9ACTN|nr:winged helix DNA-binding domain-containing protein [Streptomyces smaragdinus]MQY13641.1 hypothetical protein [Streptomyces smaragdinus]